MTKTAAERQKAYRDNKRNAPVTESVSFAPAGVTGRPKNVTRVTTEPERNAQVVMAGVTAVTGESCTELGPIDHALIDKRGGLADYHANRDKYATRAEPDKLNWGPWMDSGELQEAGLKANRVSIPGDWDYSGVGR